MDELPGTVGFVGLGAMGSELATALMEGGWRMAAFDPRSEAVEPFAARGAQACGSPAEVAAAAGVVLVSLPSPDVVREVLLGEHGLVEGGVSTFVDLSTTGGTAVALAEALAAAEVEYLDAPVSGGVAGARSRSLTVMASGQREVFERVRPLLGCFGSRIVLVGDRPGLGQTAKLLNNLLSATALAATSEAMALGVRAGLDPAALLEAINGGSGRNTATSTKFPRHVLTGSFDAGFRLRLMLKDLRLCMDEARRLDVPVPVGSGIEQMWALAANEVAEEADHTEIVRLFERWAGVEIRSLREVAAEHA